MKNLKLVKVASVRKHMDAHFRDEISYIEAVNRINEDALNALSTKRSEQLSDCKCEYPIIRTGIIEYCSICQLQVN